VVIRESSSRHAETLTRLGKAISSRGLTLFCHIDHAEGARAAGLHLPPEDVLLFGNPKAGTALMQEDPRAGYELPLRILIWQQGERVRIGYRDPRELAHPYQLEKTAGVLDAMTALLDELAAEASS
jgi:uncharacterized protein (DUF302 family)